MRHDGCMACDMERTLVHLLKVLNECGICAAARVLSDGRIEMWLGDGERGIRASAVFSAQELDIAMRWLSATASRLYPDSHFARVGRMLSRWVDGAIEASRRLT